MDCRIVLWDSDSSLKEALFSRLFRKGYMPVSLGDPGKLSKAVRWLAPELVLFESGWEKGTTVDLTEENTRTVRKGEMSVVMPIKGCAGNEDPGNFRGLVLEKLRKPFGTDELFGGIGSALELSRRIRNRPGEGCEWLEVRPLSTADEFEAALALRLSVYRETGFITDSTRKIEHDDYDPRSVHFGAFYHSAGLRELAGTVRIIHRDATSIPGSGELARAIVRHEPGYSLPMAQEGPELPSLGTFELEPEGLTGLQPGFGGGLSADGSAVSGEICEISRLAIAPAYRRGRFGIERRLFQMIVVDSCAQNPVRNWFAISVHPTRQAKFERFGFSAIGSLGVRPYAGLDQPAIFMSLDLQHYLTTPNPFSAGLDLEMLLYRAGGYLSHNLELQHALAI